MNHADCSLHFALVASESKGLFDAFSSISESFTVFCPSSLASSSSSPRFISSFIVFFRVEKACSRWAAIWCFIILTSLHYGDFFEYTVVYSCNYTSFYCLVDVASYIFHSFFNQTLFSSWWNYRYNIFRSCSKIKLIQWQTITRTTRAGQEDSRHLSCT